jgi:hypothetical protein
LNFTLSHYEKTIKNYISSGYSFCGTKNKKDKNKIIAMTHDVDHSIDLCKNFSEIEKNCGIKSTYFLRLHAKKYNMLSNSSLKQAKSILENGHEIGLHYEPSFCNSDYEKHIKKEMEILSNFLDYEITIFNIHEPARTGVDIGNILKNQNRCYNSDFFKNFKYISDSSCRWREGCFSKHINKWEKLLVLTHPFWWYNESPTENY